jgi:hypothetical protein
LSSAMFFLCLFAAAALTTIQYSYYAVHKMKQKATHWQPH